MGGLYAQQFIRMFPEKSCGLVLLDPVSPENYVLKQRLTKQEYFQCGFDKIANMKMGFVLTSLRLGFLFKPLLRKAPPFYYYPDFSKDAEDAILRNATQRKMYRSSMAEYAFIDSEKAARERQVKFPDLPLVLICHTPKVMISEIMKYGGADQATAAKCDDIWVSLMKGYLEFSNQSNYRQAENSGHFIHLSDPDGVRRALKSIQ
jgi:pimeloyl-ACP methyl ester carboxylesterase